jgi:hypothetical protein
MAGSLAWPSHRGVAESAARATPLDRNMVRSPEARSDLPRAPHAPARPAANKVARHVTILDEDFFRDSVFRFAGQPSAPLQQQNVLARGRKTVRECSATSSAADK